MKIKNQRSKHFQEHNYRIIDTLQWHEIPRLYKVQEDSSLSKIGEL